MKCPTVICYIKFIRYSIHTILAILTFQQFRDHEFHETCHSVTSHCTGQFTPKMKANAEPRLLSSLV